MAADDKTVKALSAAVARSRELIRTIPAFPNPEQDGQPAEALVAAGSRLWIYRDRSIPDESPPEPQPPAPKAKAAAKGKAEPPPDKGPEEKAKMEAKLDPQGGALFLSHVWDEPEHWSEHFTAQSFTEAKHDQVEHALRKAERRGFNRPGSSPRVWIDIASLPTPVTPSDHPLEQVLFGPYKLSVLELKKLVPKVPDGQQLAQYTVLHLPEDYRFQGAMKLTKYDCHGRPLQNPEEQEVQWCIPAGWHFIRTCRVIPEGLVSPAAAAELEEYRPLKEQLRSWCLRLALREEVWVELTLGSFRSECLLLADTILTLHGGLVAVVTWNYFDRLWPLWEWAVFCACCGPHRVQLAADCFASKAVVEYHRAIRRLSVESTGCRDARDRPMLLDAFEKLFKCGVKDETTSFKKPSAAESISAVKERKVDFAPVERFVRATVIAAFAREAALAASKKLGEDDACGWIALAEEMGFFELHRALKKCKPWDWMDAIRSKGSEGADEAYETTVEAWWGEQVLPELEHERQLAVR